MRKVGKIFYRSTITGGAGFVSTSHEMCCMIFLDPDTWDLRLGQCSVMPVNPSGNKGAAMWAKHNGMKLSRLISKPNIAVTKLERRRGVTEEEWERMRVFDAL